MDKFDLKKFLTENKLTKTSVLREGLDSNDGENIGKEVEAAVEDKLAMTVAKLSDAQKDQLRSELAKAGITADSKIEDVANKLDENIINEGDTKAKVADALSSIGSAMVTSLLVPIIPVAIGLYSGLGVAAGFAIHTAVAGGLIGLAKLLGAEGDGVIKEGKEKEYTDRDEWRIAVKAKYPEAKPNPKFNEDNIYLDSEGNRVAMWSNDTNTGAIGFTAKPKDQPDLIYPKGSRMDETKKEALKAKIKEMIIAELSLEEENAPINMVTTMDGKTVVGTHQYGVGFKSNEAGQKMGFKDNPTSIPNGTKMSKGMDMNEDIFAPTSKANPVAENVGEVGEKDYEDYQELKKFLNTLSTTKNPNAYTDDIFNYNSEIDPNEGYDEFDAQYDEKFKLSEFFIDEAKKDEEEAPAEDAPEEEVDATLDTTATGEDFNIDTSAVDPNIKAVQDALTQAQAAAKNINDDKLTTQISNTVIMFTRDHVANTKPISEGKSLTDGLTSEEKKIYDKVKNTITYKGMKKYDSKEYSKKLQKALQAAAMHNEESER